MEIILSRQARKFLDKLTDKHVVAIREALEGLIAKPLIGDIKKLKRSNGEKRLRVGDIRIVFKITGSVVCVMEIDYRGNIYQEDASMIVERKMIYDIVELIPDSELPRVYALLNGYISTYDEDEEELTPEEERKIDEGWAQIERGEYITLDEYMKKRGLMGKWPPKN